MSTILIKTIRFYHFIKSVHKFCIITIEDILVYTLHDDVDLDTSRPF